MNRNILLLILVTITTALINTGCATALVGGTAASVAAVHDRRSAGVILDDQTIKARAKLALLQDDSLNGTHINVTSMNNVVLLTGEAQTNAQKARAAELASNIEKVRQVHNEVVIAAPTSMMSRSSDTLITAKVKSELVTIRGLEDFDLTRVKIVTENGIVYLMGLVTRPEADAVTDVARRIKGVQRVVRLFEYIS